MSIRVNDPLTGPLGGLLLARKEVGTASTARGRAVLKEHAVGALGHNEIGLFMRRVDDGLMNSPS